MATRFAQYASAFVPTVKSKWMRKTRESLLRKYGVTATTSSGSTFPLRRSINWCLLYSAKNISVEAARLMNFVLSAHEKGLNTNGKVGRSSLTSSACATGSNKHFDRSETGIKIIAAVHRQFLSGGKSPPLTLRQYLPTY